MPDIKPNSKRIRSKIAENLRIPDFSAWGGVQKVHFRVLSRLRTQEENHEEASEFCKRRRLG